MEGETLVEWMLRRREEIARNAAADGVVRDTMERLKRKLRNVYRTHGGSSPERKMILWPESGKKSTRRVTENTTQCGELRL